MVVGSGAETPPVVAPAAEMVNLTALRLVPPPASAEFPAIVDRPPARPSPSGELGLGTRLRDPAPGSGGWRLSFDTGEVVVVRGPGLIGRRPEPRPGETVVHRVVLPSPELAVSKTHAQFSVAEDGVLVMMDRGSTNGTVLIRHGVQRELAPGRPTTLLAGDRVRFGAHQVVVGRGEEPEP